MPAMLKVLVLSVLVKSAVAGTTPEGLEYLRTNKEREGVVELPSGLQYEVLKSGPADGPRPNASSPCSVHYKGALVTGEEFDSSYKRGNPTTFAPNQVVKGWTEALQLMRPGDHWKLFVPSELAYGDRGAGGRIPGGAVLVFELELLDVQEGGSFLDQAVSTLQQNPMFILVILFGLYKVYEKFFAGGAGGKEQLSIDKASAAPENTTVFFDITIGGEAQERVEFQLFNGSCPKTADNFRCLCTGEKGKGKSGKDLTFKGSKFHRIIPGFMCQGGDFTRGNGTGGESIYGVKFDDEWDNGYIVHDRPYLLSMANAGANTNGSQFFITVAATPHLNGKHVVFGKVIKGEATIKAMEKVGSGSGSTRSIVAIEDCGELKSKNT